MIKKVLTIVLFLIAFFCDQPLFAQFSYDEYESLLKEYVRDDKVDYQGLISKSRILDEFTQRLSEVSPRSHPGRFESREAQLAYWINAYNAFILKIIVDNYPLDSIKDIKLIGFTVWLHKNLIGGEEISFKYLEDDIIREIYKDPRIHFAINCASYSCPPLSGSVYRPLTLNQQMDAATSAFINNPENFSVDEEAKIVWLSAIFNWYDDDFYQWLQTKKNIKEPHLLDFIKDYYNSEIKAAWYAYELEFFDYNWQVNDFNAKK